ncbi:uncharacterized protein GGS22DRAFT_115708 [Annulohypoxylon maeteangense]|uniref:uncharacterized protein n=1 Tax=Annulohypoxylon maeteangense TaxID=1927788 RepID=UPI0020089401|nr:uncharacterized protein GGS22DRAFT_115708 [Annulohypoxylon maeteangense]KAI0886621.1 hypothetical protein GGS22DRAFT_115708 [Annulohypoxylon maeteangense]
MRGCYTGFGIFLVFLGLIQVRRGGFMVRQVSETQKRIAATKDFWGTMNYANQWSSAPKTASNIPGIVNEDRGGQTLDTSPLVPTPPYMVLLFRYCDILTN